MRTIATAFGLLLSAHLLSALVLSAAPLSVSLDAERTVVREYARNHAIEWTEAALLAGRAEGWAPSRIALLIANPDPRIEEFDNQTLREQRWTDAEGKGQFYETTLRDGANVVASFHHHSRWEDGAIQYTRRLRFSSELGHTPRTRAFTSAMAQESLESHCTISSRRVVRDLPARNG